MQPWSRRSRHRTRATHQAAGETHTYTWTTGAPPYYVITIGGPQRIAYLSLKKER